MSNIVLFPFSRRQARHRRPRRTQPPLRCGLPVNCPVPSPPPSMLVRLRCGSIGGAVMGLCVIGFLIFRCPQADQRLIARMCRWHHHRAPFQGTCHDWLLRTDRIPRRWLDCDELMPMKTLISRAALCFLAAALFSRHACSRADVSVYRYAVAVLGHGYGLRCCQRQGRHCDRW